MKVCVVGLWHLGSVTAACLADLGHEVVGFDADEQVTRALRDGKPPLFEPGLSELVQRGLAQGRLTFSSDRASALRGAEAIWVTYDTPVDDDDVADVEFVVEQIASLFPYLAD